jgi:trehalose synthase
VRVGVERIAVDAHCRLDDYAADSSLTHQVRELVDEARLVQPQLAGRTVWMVSSTAAGGGVAEMMPRLVSLLVELGLDARWLVMHAEPEFFALTKRLHNLIHGVGALDLGPADRELYESTSRACADALVPLLRPRDFVVVHDPQPLGVGALARRTLDVRAIWRCHIGHGEDSAQARAAWSFLRPWLDGYDRAVFSAPEYFRDFLAGRASLIYPSIDPLDHKNRELAPTKLAGILANAGLLEPTHPVLAPPFADRAARMRADGQLAPAVGELEIGLPFRPVVTQISRWDRLKGFLPLLDGFCALKQRSAHSRHARHRRRIELLRLVLAGPDPSGIKDDPEANEVLAELGARYRRLTPSLQRDIAVVVLPMTARKHNALMVNCLQRCSALVAQVSLREGFALTITEAMWKGVAVLGSRSTGIRQQVRDGLDGRLLADPDDPMEIAETLDLMLADAKQRMSWGRSARGRVARRFLIFRQLRDWLRLFVESR